MENEKQLIESAKADKTQFVHLYNRHFTQIYRYIITRVANQHTAEDITSETFMKALENIDKYNWTGKPFSAWLYRIAINEINDHYRKNKTERDSMMKQWGEIEKTFDAADLELKKSEDKEEQLGKIGILNQAFQKLNPAEQSIISLKYFENLSYKDIADTLNLSVSNVGVKLTRATNRLSQICNFSEL